MKNEILIIDIETTGFIDGEGKIVEVGLVALDLNSGDKRIVFDSVTHERPLTRNEVVNSWIVSNGYMNVEEIRHSKELKTLKPAIQAVIDEFPNGITAFNRAFDCDFFEDRGFVFPKKLPCPMLLSMDLCKLPHKKLNSFNKNDPYKYPKVEEAWEFFFGKDTGYVELHRGADDAFHEADIVYELYKMGLFKLEETVAEEVAA